MSVFSDYCGNRAGYDDSLRIQRGSISKKKEPGTDRLMLRINFDAARFLLTRLEQCDRSSISKRGWVLLAEALAPKLLDQALGFRKKGSSKPVVSNGFKNVIR